MYALICSVSLLVYSAEVVEGAPEPLKTAASKMTVPEGFQVTLFAGEPDVVQPIAMTTDDRGRLWVVECLSYPQWREEATDRVLIFEDRDNDGRFDSRTVFWDKGVNLSGIEWGFGGVWLCATPNLLFIPDRDGDDRPDGPPVIVLDGWDLKAKHNVFNGLSWGPDCWLWGCNGILSNSLIGPPGTPEEQRTAINCGVWRVHPVTHRFEAVAHGTTNPWGLDFDQYGQAFITNCVIEHVFHVVPGARFKRMFGQDFNPHAYGLMQTCANHIHWAGGPWQQSRGGVGEHNKTGGGHAHSGAMIYLGDNWPAEYRNHLFTCNIHGNRVNRDRLNLSGSGYVATHEADFLFANDTWFRGLELIYGPDGGVYLCDWSDAGECHDYDHIDRSNGRIYKVTFRTPERRNPDLQKQSDEELAKLQTHANEWYSRHARRVLQERSFERPISEESKAILYDLLRSEQDVVIRLRALWTLFGTRNIDEKHLLSLMDDPNEYVRGWVVRLLAEDQPSSTVRAQFADLAADDPSPHVRLMLASALQRLKPADRWPILEPLMAHSEDQKDLNLTLMIWYAAEPLVVEDSQRAAQLLASAQIPLVRSYLTRRLATLADEEPAADGLQQIVEFVSGQEDPKLIADVLKGMHDALRGRKSVRMPAGWPAVFQRLYDAKLAELRDSVLALGLIFGDEQAIDLLKQLAGETTAQAETRTRAIETLVEQRAPVARLLLSLTKDPQVRRTAIQGLAAFDAAETPSALLSIYADLDSQEKQAVIGTLVSRPEYARQLLAAVEAKNIPVRDLSPFEVRQLLNFSDSQIHQAIERLWGSARPFSEEKAAAFKKYKQMLTPETLRNANLANGRQVFEKTCANCHKLFGAGRSVGPELTGSQRTNVDYILENLLDPNAIVGREHQMTALALSDGRLLTGIVSEETAKTLTLQSATDTVVVDKQDIESRRESRVSLMPEGLLANLKEDQIRDLMAYLASPEQVPIAESASP